MELQPPDNYSLTESKEARIRQAQNQGVEARCRCGCNGSLRRDEQSKAGLGRLHHHSIYQPNCSHFSPTIPSYLSLFLYRLPPWDLPPTLSVKTVPLLPVGYFRSCRCGRVLSFRVSDMAINHLCFYRIRNRMCVDI